MDGFTHDSLRTVRLVSSKKTMNLKFLLGLLVTLLVPMTCFGGVSRPLKIYSAISANETVPDYRLITRSTDWYSFVKKYSNEQPVPLVDFSKSIVVIYTTDAADPNKLNFSMDVDKDGVASLKTFTSKTEFTPSVETKMTCLQVPRRGIKYYAHTVKKGTVEYTRREDIFSHHQIKGTLAIPKDFETGSLSVSLKLFQAPDSNAANEAQEIDERVKYVTHKSGQLTTVKFSLANDFKRPRDDSNTYFVRCELADANQSRLLSLPPSTVYEEPNGQDVTFKIESK